MLQFLTKIFLTPENIMGIIFKLVEVIGMCFLFYCLELKWWKSLIPFYDEYVLYDKVFKHKWFAFLFYSLSFFIQFRCISLFKKHILGNIWTVLQEQDLSTLNIDFVYLIFLVVIWIFTFIICFLFQRMANYKALKLLNIPSLLQIMTILLPDIFLLVDSIYFLYKRKKQQA